MNLAEDYFQNTLDDEEKKFQIFSSVDQKDIEKLKLLLNSPKWYTVEDKCGCSLLQKTINQKNKEVFDFLLSIKDFPLDNVDCAHNNALMSSLKGANASNEYYAIELIKKGANIHSVDNEGNTLLHLAIKGDYFEVCPLLIEGGIDVNVENKNGQTPLRVLCQHFKVFDADAFYKPVCMLLYYGADVSPFHDPSLGVDLFEKVLTSKTRNGDFQELLFYHVIDEYSNYEMGSSTLLSFMLCLPDYALFYEIIDKTKDIVEENLRYYASNVFVIGNSYMKVLLKKFDYFIKRVLRCGLKNCEQFYFNSESLENFDLLLKSNLVDDTIKLINSLSVTEIILDFEYSSCGDSTIKELIYYLLPYLPIVYADDLVFVYKRFGYCELFKVLLHMDMDYHGEMYDVIPLIFFNVNFNLGDYLDYYRFHTNGWYEEGIPNEYDDETIFAVENFDKLLDLFADQRLKNFCNREKIKQLVVKAKHLSQVPLLQELARESCRKFLIAKYNITTSRQFYTILNWLPISNTHRKIISYETALYHIRENPNERYATGEKFVYHVSEDDT